MRASLGAPDLIGRLLASRGVALEEASLFLNPTLKDLFPDPSTFADMDRAAEAILDAIVSGRPDSGVRRLRCRWRHVLGHPVALFPRLGPRADPLRARPAQRRLRPDARSRSGAEEAWARNSWSPSTAALRRSMRCGPPTRSASMSSCSTTTSCTTTTRRRRWRWSIPTGRTADRSTASSRPPASCS